MPNNVGDQRGATPPGPQLGAVPLPPPPGAPADAPAPMAVDALVAGLKAGQARWKPVPEEDDVAPQAPAKTLYPWLQSRLEGAVNAVFARRPAGPPRPQMRVQRAEPAWDPATASRNGDGSLAPPTAQPTGNAPDPGLGSVSPTGLTRGNSVFRFGAGGAPSNFTILDQGPTNGCGTTSLAMMLNFHAGGQMAFDREKIDRRIRNFDIFSSPGDIAAFAERRGMDAAIHTGTTPAQLRALIDQGLPVQILMDVAEAHDGSGLHYEVVTGYGTGPDGKAYFELANPWGEREFMAEDALMARWSDLSAKGFPLGIDRMAIVMKPKGHPARLPADDRHAFFDTGMTALRAAQGLTQVTSGWARADVPTLLGGVVRMLGCGLAGIPALLGGAGARWGERTMSDGAGLLGSGLGPTFRGLGKLLVGGGAWVVSKPVEAAGNVLARGMDLVASGVSATGRAIARAVGSL